MKNNHLIISGIQGSGKGTQARLLSKRFSQYTHISSGDLCRWHIANKTEFSEELSGIHQGKFVHDDTIIEIMERKIQSIQTPAMCILDGFPRNIEQAQYLIQNYSIDAVIHLNLNETLAVQRTQNRLKEKTIRLDDTNPDSIKKRIQLYNENNLPLSKLYKRKNILYQFSSEPHPDIVHENIVVHLQEQKILPQG